MNKQLGYVIGGVAVVIAGYGFYLNRQAEKLKSLQYRFQNIKFDNIGLTNVKMRADIVINNPSDVKFVVKGYDLDIIFKGTKIANVKKSDINTTLYPSGVATLPIEVQLDPLSVGENLLSVLLSNFALGTQSKGGVQFVGKISGRFGLIGFKNIDVNYSTQ